MSKPSVFISYSRRDAGLAQRVESALERLGLDAFNPAREVRPGENWRHAIHAAIKRSDALIMLIGSQKNLTSSWMTYEAGMAEALGKRVMVLLANKHSANDLPVDIASGQIVGFDPQAPARAAHDIVKRLAVA